MKIEIGKEYKTDIKLGYVDFYGGGNLSAIIKEDCLIFEDDKTVKLYSRIKDRFSLDESDWERAVESANTPIIGTWDFTQGKRYITFEFEKHRFMIGVIHKDYPNSILCHTHISFDSNGHHHSNKWESTFNLV